MSCPLLHLCLLLVRLWVQVGVGVGEEDTYQQENNLINKNNPSDFGVQEASFRENVLDFEVRER